MIQIDNLGTPGIVTDVPPHELPINAWSSGNNVRFRDNVVERSLSETEVYSDPTIAPYWMLPYADGTNLAWFYANASKIYRVIGATHLDVTRVANDYSAGSYPHWNGGVIGGIPIMNNTAFADPPQQWDSSTTKFVDLGNWPINATPTSIAPDWQAKVIRPFKQFLIALDMNEDEGSGATRYPTRVRWSSPADPGTVPLHWLPASTNLAGSVPLSEETDFLVDAQALRDVMVIYKENATYLMQHTGGVFVFGFRRAFSEFGLLARRCVKSFYGKHFVVSQGDVIVHDGQNADSIIRNKLRRNLFSTIDSDNYENTFVVAYPDRAEMWICIPTSGSTFCNRAYIWHWKDNSWTIRDLPDVAHIGLGIISSSDAPIIDNMTATIDSYTTPFDERNYNPSVLQLLMGAAGLTTPKFYQADVGYAWDTDEGKYLSYGVSYVERTGLALVESSNGGVTVDTQSVKFCRRIYPKIDADPGVKVTVRVGSQEYIDGPVTWQTTVEFDPDTDRHIDCRCQGVAMAVQFKSSSGGGWRLSSYGMDVQRVGTI